MRGDVLTEIAASREPDNASRGDHKQHYKKNDNPNEVVDHHQRISDYQPIREPCDDD